MAALVTGLARLFQPTMMLPGGKPGGLGMAPWYLLLGLRLVALLFANDPWSSAKADLACNWTKTTVEEHLQPFCKALCFNQHFSSAVSSVWGLGFLLGLFPVGLMGLVRVASKHQKKAASAAEEEQTNPCGVSHGLEAGFGMAARPHPSPREATLERKAAPSDAKTSSTWRLVAFAFSVILLLVMESGFLWIVIALQIPLVSETTFRCQLGGRACPPTLECVMLGQVDKQVALWGLIFTAIVNVMVCLSYLLLRLKKVSQCHQ
ncbi:uncharacterized protein LOC134497405 [Candoia aspera]|uniref:uncharacterized protein LOC134497405 n=1 Tax=Candoia aspera TaxID=51853 RepID=UPI002FD8151C